MFLRVATMRGFHVLLLVALLTCLPLGVAEASCELSSVRLGSVLVKVGDAERRALEADPDRRVRLETAEGGAAGYRLDFHQARQTVQIYIRAGRVVRICRVRS